MLKCKITRRLLAGFIGITLSISIVVSWRLGGLPAVYAQATTASLSGTIIDETGAVVPDVKITILNTATGLQRRAATTSDGYFRITLVPPGNYTLTAEMPGFATINVNTIALQVSIDSYIQITLRPKPISESIEVRAGAGADVEGGAIGIDISDATMKYSIGNKQVVSLPILTSNLGRNTLGVLPYTVPGVTPTIVFGSGQADTNLRGNQMSINGSRPSSISFNLDGGDNNDYELNQAAAPLPNPDALQEFTVITNNYQADLGRSSGGIINAVIKSGTNQFRGNGRSFLRNESLDARSFFDPRVPRDRLNTFGGQLGGPVVLPRLFNGKNRAFFFIDYEGTRSSNESPSIATVLSADERKGDFHSLPASAQPRDPLTGKPFPGGLISPGRISPIARTYLDRFIPLPNDGERSFRSLLLNKIRNDQITSHLDYRATEADALSAAFVSISSTTADEVSTLPAGSKINTEARNENVVLRETHTFSTRTVSQFTGTLTRFVDEQLSFSPGATGVHPKEIGFTGVRPQTGKFLAPPRVTIVSDSDINMLTGGDSFERAKTTWQLKDDLSQIRGSQSLKFGGEIRGFIENLSLGNDNGYFQFGKASPISRRNAIADFLLGNPSVYMQSSGSTRYPRQRGYYFYGMDDWRIKPNLTINLGLRYELSPPVKDELDQVIAFRPRQQSRRFPDAPQGLLFVGDPDPVLGVVGPGLYPADRKDFAPRLGIAYSPKPESGWTRFLFGEGKTALRAGWGMFYDQTPGLVSTQFSFAEPFSVSQRVNLSQIRSAGGTFANPFGSRPNPWPLDLQNSTFFSQRPSLHVIDPTFQTAYTYQYNLTIQRELPWSLLLDAAYVGTNGFKLDRERDLNATVFERDPVTGARSSHRVYAGYGDILSHESTGRARYDSLQVKVKRRFSGGLMLDGSYVFGKAFDNGSDPVSALDSPEDISWGRSSFDRTHNFVLSYSYDLPTLSLRGLAGSVLNGWQISGITEFRSGMPMGITLSSQTSVNSSAIRPDIVGPYVRFDPRKYQTLTVNGAPQSGNFFFDPNTFFDFGDGRLGTLGRNLFEGPGLNLWSASLVKRFQIKESQHFLLRADIRNLFNHANFQLPFLGVRETRFGQVTSAAPGRNVQLSLRYSF